MTRSTKSALLSGLVFPGIGHMVLKKYLRGSALIISALIASSIIVTIVIQRALTIVDRINSGDIPVETRAIAEMVSNSTNGVDSLIENISVIVLGACWLIGIIDSYRLGIAQEKQNMRMTACGRQRTLISLEYWSYERPLSGKADIQLGALENRFPNDRFPPETGHQARIGEKGPL